MSENTISLKEFALRSGLDYSTAHKQHKSGKLDSWVENRRIWVRFSQKTDENGEKSAGNESKNLRMIHESIVAAQAQYQQLSDENALLEVKLEKFRKEQEHIGNQVDRLKEEEQRWGQSVLIKQDEINTLESRIDELSSQLVRLQKQQKSLATIVHTRVIEILVQWGKEDDHLKQLIHKEWFNEKQAHVEITPDAAPEVIIEKELGSEFDAVRPLLLPLSRYHAVYSEFFESRTTLELEKLAQTEGFNFTQQGWILRACCALFRHQVPPDRLQ